MFLGELDDESAAARHFDFEGRFAVDFRGLYYVVLGVAVSVDSVAQNLRFVFDSLFQEIERQADFPPVPIRLAGHIPVFAMPPGSAPDTHLPRL